MTKAASREAMGNLTPIPKKRKERAMIRERWPLPEGKSEKQIPTGHATKAERHLNHKYIYSLNKSPYKRVLFRRTLSTSKPIWLDHITLDNLKDTLSVLPQEMIPQANSLLYPQQDTI